MDLQLVVTRPQMHDLAVVWGATISIGWLFPEILFQASVSQLAATHAVTLVGIVSLPPQLAQRTGSGVGDPEGP
jgi:hypothetical protein